MFDPQNSLPAGAPLFVYANAEKDPFEMRTMKRSPFALILTSVVFCCATMPLHSQALNANYARDANQPIDQEYTRRSASTPPSRSFRR